MAYDWEWQGLEQRAQEIQAQIFLLKKEREVILRLDPDYAEYLDEFAERGEGEPLSIRQFHQYSDEMDRINAEFAGNDVDFEALWAVHRERIVVLERLLLA